MLCRVMPCAVMSYSVWCGVWCVVCGVWCVVWCGVRVVWCGVLCGVMWWCLVGWGGMGGMIRGNMLIHV